MTNKGKATTSIFSRKIRIKHRPIAKKNTITGKCKAMRLECPSSQQYSKEVKFMILQMLTWFTPYPLQTSFPIVA